jgi:hypothetical protein
MVKSRKKDSRKRLNSKRFNETGGRARKINASTAVAACSERDLCTPSVGFYIHCNRFPLKNIINQL